MVSKSSAVMQDDHEKSEPVRGGSTRGSSRDGSSAPTSAAKGAESKQGGWASLLPAGVKAPITVLFPPKSPEGTLPLIAKSSSRAAWRARKLLFRAMIVTLSCFILLLEPVSIKALGNAAFFACIVSIMIPPIMPAMVFILVATMLVMGMLLGWAWSCAAMAASLPARNQVLLASALQIAQQTAATAVNPTAAFQSSIFHGDFLDWRSTLVFGFFFAIGTFCMGLVRAKQPKLTLVAIFASIVMDVMISYGPLFPFAQYKLATSFLIPTACFIAIALVANFVIFPETLNSSYTTDLVDKFLIPIYSRSKLHSRLLSTTPPTKDGGNEAWKALDGEFESTQQQMSASLEGLLGSVAMMELEVSMGRLSAQDLKRLTAKLHEVLSRSMGLGVLYRTVSRQHRRRFGAGKDVSASTISIPTQSNGKQPNLLSSSSHPPTARMQRMRDKVEAAERQHNHGLDALLPILAHSSLSLRSATDEALLGAMEWLTTTTASRWGRQPNAEVVEERYQAQRARVTALESALVEWRTSKRSEVCAPFADFFDAETGKLLPGKDGRFSPSSLFIVLSASDNLTVYAQTMLEFVTHVSDLEGKRRKNRLWWPTGLRKVGNLLRGGKGAGEMGDGENPDTVTLVGDGEEEEEEAASVDKGKKKKRGKGESGTPEEEEDLFARRKWESHDPDARPPKNGRQRIALKLYHFSQSLQTAEAIFAFKYMAISVLLWLPQIFPSSAYFCYTEKGLWALIMAQTGLAVYAGDQILQTIHKLAGTALGLVYGMLIWYIGAGTGTGNRIGLGAAFFVFMIPPMALRIFAPPALMQFSMLGAVSVVLVVGYSWSNTHIPTLGSIGYGYSIAWRRALLVVIGVAAATIAMLVPPQSTRLLVRRTHATCIDRIGRMYAATLSAWLSEERHDAAELNGTELPEEHPSVFTESLQKSARSSMLAVWVKINGSKAAILQSSYELSLRGDWPRREYLHLLETQLGLVQSIAQLGSALTRLDPAWRRTLVRSTAFLNPNLISDVSSTFFLLSLALRQGSPLPQATPGPLLDRLLYHDSRLRKFTSAPITEDAHPAAEANGEHPSQPQVEGASAGDFELTFEVLKDARFATHASALLALANVLSGLDELEETVKELVGEVSMPGYARLLQRAAEV